MTGRTVVALLDPPASLRFRAVPYLVEAGDHFLVCGWPDLKRKERAADEVEELYQAGYALKLDEPVELPEGFEGRLGWIGTEFLKQARDAGCVPREVELVDFVEVGERGKVWAPVGEDSVAQSLEQWLHQAAAKVFRASVEQRRALAFLMKRCDPHHELTRAAVWWALENNDAEQTKHLAWIERLERDRGRGEECSVDRQRQRYQQIRNSYSSTPVNGDVRRRPAQGQSRMSMEGHVR